MYRTSTRLAFAFTCAALLPLGTGCGDDSSLPVPNADGGITGKPDMAQTPDMAHTPDMTPAPDMTPPPPPPGGICRGTRLENSCVAAFFAPAVECFQIEGACKRASDVLGSMAACWANGAAMKTTLDFQQLTVVSSWRRGNEICLEAKMVDGGNGSPLATFKRGGATLQADEQGNVVCPDGSKLNIGEDFGGCAELDNILNPNLDVCVDGSCG